MSGSIRLVSLHIKAGGVSPLRVATDGGASCYSKTAAVAAPPGCARCIARRLSLDHDCRRTRVRSRHEPEPHSFNFWPRFCPKNEPARSDVARFGLGDKSETHSSSEWGIGAAATENLPEFEMKMPAMKAAEVDEAKLLKGLAAASGPNNQQGQSLPNSNPHWSNAGGSWSYEFPPRATKAIAAAINTAITETTPGIEGFSKQLSPALKKHAIALGKWVIESAQRNERFTALLWWKQALYSPSLRRSYRELSPAGTAIALSFDLVSVSGAPVPLSVEYFLRETIRNLLPENPKLTLAELVTATSKGDPVDPCLPTAPSGAPHRISLREFLSVVRQAVPPDEAIPSYAGVVPSTSLPISEWAVWLLRERLAEMLTAPKA